jgi:hypothetical protein
MFQTFSGVSYAFYVWENVQLLSLNEHRRDTRQSSIDPELSMRQTQENRPADARRVLVLVLVELSSNHLTLNEGKMLDINEIIRVGLSRSKHLPSASW